MIEEIESFHVDTIVQSPEEAKEYPSMYDVLRKYPELFHAAENAQKEYDKWVEMERMMISTALIGKDNSQEQMAEQKSAAFDACMKAVDVRNALSDAITRDDIADGSTVWVDNEKILNEYINIMSEVPDGMKDSESSFSTDEVKSSIGRARKRWEQYFNQVTQMAEAIPAQYRAQFIYLFNIQCKQHLADLKNRYCDYYSERKGNWIADNVIIEE